MEIHVAIIIVSIKNIKQHNCFQYWKMWHWRVE